MVIFKLNNFILWDYDCKVDVVIMIVLKESDVKIVGKLFDIILRVEVIDRLKYVDLFKEILDILLKM